MGQFKYFEDSEVVGLKPDLVYKLDRARDFYGFPIVITSGYRNPDRNKLIGGAKDSEHLYGQAADIQAPQDQAIREKLMWALGLAGIKRVESAKKHFHVDISTSKMSPYWWQGPDL